MSRDLDDLPGKASVQVGLLESRLEIGERILHRAEVGQVDSRGEAEEVRGGEGGPECEALSRPFDASAHAQVHGWRSFGHVMGTVGRIQREGVVCGIGRSVSIGLPTACALPR